MLKRAISVGARFECQNATLLERVQSVLDYKEHSQNNSEYCRQN